MNMKLRWKHPILICVQLQQIHGSQQEYLLLIIEKDLIESKLDKAEFILKEFKSSLECKINEFPAIAQLVERLTVEDKRSYQAVHGSTPCCRTIF